MLHLIEITPFQDLKIPTILDLYMEIEYLYHKLRMYCFEHLVISLDPISRKIIRLIYTFCGDKLDLKTIFNTKKNHWTPAQVLACIKLKLENIWNEAIEFDGSIDYDSLHSICICLVTYANQNNKN